MAEGLSIRAGQCSKAGAKPVNEDCVGLRIPEGETLRSKGIAAVIADGASGHAGGKVAAECAVQGFLADYYSTPDPWSVKQSAHKVLTAINHWLYAEGRRLYAEHHGLLTTFSALVLKAGTAHLFHIGDTRIYRLRDTQLEQLTRDHQLHLADGKSYLSRALGADLNVEIDYQQLPLDPGDLFLLMSDGVYALLRDADIKLAAQTDSDLEALCAHLIEQARTRGSADNLSCQALRITSLPALDADAFYRRLTELPFPPSLSVGQRLDGYRVLRELHLSARSQVYLAMDERSEQRVALKTPSPNYSDDPAYIDGFLQEEWIGRRVNHPHVVRVLEPPGERHFLYYATEYLEGDTLQQWMRDHPKSSLHEIRAIVEQIASGLRAFHRLQTVHRDLKPDNIVIDAHGIIKLIDFGCAHIAAFADVSQPHTTTTPPGTRDYGAPELLAGHRGDERSDQFSLAVIAYQLLTGSLPYARGHRPAPKERLLYRSATTLRPELPLWMDKALQRALHPDPAKRYPALSEFTFDLAHPNAAYAENRSLPLLERDPVSFWRSLALILALVCLYLGYRLLTI